MSLGSRAIASLILIGLSPSVWSFSDGWTSWEMQKIEETTRRQALIDESSSCDIEDNTCISFTLRRDLSSALNQLGRFPDGLSVKEDLIPRLKSSQDEAEALFYLIFREIAPEDGSNLNLLLRRSPASRQHLIWAELKRAVAADPASVCVRAGIKGVSITCLVKIITIQK